MIYDDGDDGDDNKMRDKRRRYAVQYASRVLVEALACATGGQGIRVGGKTEHAAVLSAIDMPHIIVASQSSRYLIRTRHMLR